MPFQRFVESGRVAYIADGDHSGKLCTIVDVIDQSRALVDGPETGVPRTAVRFKQLHLTKFKFSLPYTAPTRLVRKNWKDAKITEKWAESSWAQKIAARKRRDALTDFDRFKLGRARQTRNRIITRVYQKLKTKAARSGRVYPGKKRCKKSANPKNAAAKAAAKGKGKGKK
ncbi:large ribosomal subunit protein eL14 [Neocloeon triangulifer]|uniref:large ribosomal subunit protein eL14 n=1 Tax=Neocloeon triangulifer TaxID=2078957 RepID=UPI00286F7F04|nr:large ribosomal subunit protein eL14 [Neocloeon triangulifer]